MAQKSKDEKVNIGSRKGFGTAVQQAFTWANIDPDLCRHMAALGHKELKCVFSSMLYSWLTNSFKWN